MQDAMMLYGAHSTARGISTRSPENEIPLHLFTTKKDVGCFWRENREPAAR